MNTSEHISYFHLPTTVYVLLPPQLNMSLNEFVVKWRGILREGCSRDLWGPSTRRSIYHRKNYFSIICLRYPTVVPALVLKLLRSDMVKSIYRSTLGEKLTRQNFLGY